MNFSFIGIKCWRFLLVKLPFSFRTLYERGRSFGAITELFLCYIIDFIVHVSSHLLQSTLYCSCFISVIQSTLHWSCFILFHSVQSPSHSFHLPQSTSFILNLIGCIHTTWSFNLIVSFTFQPIPSLEINDLRVSLDKFLILGRYSLLKAEFRWFNSTLALYIKQKVQHGVRRNVLVCSEADVYLSIYSTEAYVGKQ